jgi:peptidoglycan/LPS O-acetylase OafA/YrhL
MLIFGNTMYHDKQIINKNNLNYRPDIDGLRAVAVLSVIGFHYFPDWFSGGFIGVDIFFVISGFLICSIIINSIEKNNFKFLKFYGARIRRIFPTLLLILVFVCIYGYIVFLPIDYKNLAKHIFGGAFYATNLLLAREGGYFDIENVYKPLLHLWSLGIEEQFYIFLPILLVLVNKIRKNYLKIQYIYILSFLLIFSLLYNIYLCKIDYVKNFYYPFTRIWELLAGCTLYKVTKTNNINIKFINIIILISIILIIISIFKMTSDLFPGIKAIIPVSCSMIIIALGNKSFFNKIILSNKIMVNIGLISYPLYLWHWPIYSSYNLTKYGLINIYDKVLMIIITVFCSIISYIIIEKPIRFNYNNKILKTISCGICMFIIGIIGLYIYLNNGFENRKNIMYVNNIRKEALKNVDSYDKDCLEYISDAIVYKEIIYCRYSNSNSNEIVAIYGDSHGLYAFPGIAKVNSSRGVDTLYLGRTGMFLPYIGLYDYVLPNYQQDWENTTHYIYNKLINDNRIKKVFIITRGVLYIKQKDLDYSMYNNTKQVPSEKFKKALQSTIDILLKSGKKVYLVSENPVLPVPAINILSSIKETNKTFLSKDFVLKHQEDYLNIINNLKGVTIINSLDIFCPDKDCLITDSNGNSLYKDDDHLSQEGSIFQAEKLLYKYLVE